jgi:ATP-binding cassette, subfamily B (MDR/TAP), member 7
MTSILLVRWSYLSRKSTRSFIPNCPSQVQRAIHTSLPRSPFRSSRILPRREYQNLSQGPHSSSQPSSSPTSQSRIGKPPSAPPNSPPPPTTPAERELSTREQRRNDWAIIKRLLVHIWPRNDWGVRGRVVFGVGLLIAGKVWPRQGFNERRLNELSSIRF